MSSEEIRSSFKPDTESRLINEMAMLLACGVIPDSLRLSSALGVDSQHLNGCVKILFGCSLYKLMSDYRHLLAFDLVSKTELPAKDIARRCGFKSAQILYNYFDRYEKTTFAKLRASHQHVNVTTTVAYEVQ
ncbi:MAG: AraC family transcriptional regulator [Bacteroidales bacterium]|nr:AraC family transcriptional regulator [Candidatus Liminaster caballi]